MNDLAERAIERIRELYRHFRLADEADPPVAEGDAGRFEHLLHELSHAAHLRIDPEADLFRVGALWLAVNSALYEGPSDISCLDNRISSRITMASIIGKQEAVHFEAMAWGIEWRAWQLLDLLDGDAFSWPNALIHAEVQGVEEEEIVAALARRSCLRHARHVIQQIERALS